MRRASIYALVVATCVAVPIALDWKTTPPPAHRQIRVEMFRYGTSPSIIRANRGDRLTLSFSTRDTAHSMLLQPYRIEVKVAPASETVDVIDPLRVNDAPRREREVALTAGTPGLLGRLVALSRFHCHTYCGPMHGFEQGDLVVRPNVLLSGGLGLLLAIGLVGTLRVRWDQPPPARPSRNLDLTAWLPGLRRLLTWRPLQFVATLPALAGFVLIVLAGLVGTKVAGRNLATMMTWAVWMSLLAGVLVHVNTRVWCLICPLPTPGEFLQRGALTQVRPAESRGRFGNRFFGLGRRWPTRLRGPWLRLVLFVLLSTFAASLAGQPRWTAILLLTFAGIGLLVSLVWELRAFCRYLCPAAAFISLYSRAGRLAVQDRQEDVCHECAGRPCLRGNAEGWACPYGQAVPRLTNSSECGLCTECFKSCAYDNVSLAWRRDWRPERFATYGEAWTAVAMLVLAALYSLTIHSPWPAVRDMVNVVDKATWLEFAGYSLGVVALTLGLAPLLFWTAVRLGLRLTGRDGPAGAPFKATMPALVPLGLGLWAAFFVAVVMTNATFILYTLSDPFGRGWNLLGTAGIPWVQIWPSAIPWIQVGAVLAGLALAFRRGYRAWFGEIAEPRAALAGFLPTATLLSGVAGSMLVYFSYF